MSAATHASGKGHRDENFPVASWLIRRRHRPAVMAFYRFARAADDIADHATAGAVEKRAGLDALEATLVGRDDAEPTAKALRAMLAERRLDARHPLDLLAAFRRDVDQSRYRDWDDLIEYCRLSAMPVGRFVLDVHGESRTLWPKSDALCAGLQIVNHLQDCAKDYRALDRVYIPADALAAAGAGTEELGAPRASPALRSAIAGLAQRTIGLFDEAKGFAAAIADRRLGIEVAVIHRLATSLACRLIRRDPLSQRVHHRGVEALGIAGIAAASRMLDR